MSPVLVEIVQLWWRDLPLGRMALIVLASVLLAVAWALRPSRSLLASQVHGRWPAWRRGLVIVGSFVVGYQLVLNRAALFDDAFITFHYARNFAEGLGLVFNPGERVEGYTNFLWTVLIGALHALTPFEAPAIGLALCLVAFGCNLLLIARLGRILCERSSDVPHLPLATLLLALHGVTTSYGTSGLETGAASLLVSLGALFLVRGQGVGDAARAGLMLILAALMRPDHGLFYAVGGLVLLGDRVPDLIAAYRGGKDGVRGLWRAGGGALAAYAATFGIYALYLLWKLSYYGDLLPNTYYAKSAHLTWFEQGRVYAATFYLGSQDWLVVIFCLVWLARPSADAGVRRFKLFLAGSFVVYNFYVAKVGGDFMFGRFYVSLIPLYLLGAEALIHELFRRRPVGYSEVEDGHPGLSRPDLSRRAVAGLAAGLLLASSQEVRLIPEHQVRWGIADETTYYRIKSFHPLVAGHSQELTGRFFGRTLKERGLEVVLGTGGPGSVAYYSRLEVVDTRGLTDAFVARQPLHERGRPGHEKVAPREYLLQRGVHLLRMHAAQNGFHPPQWQRVVHVDFGPASGGTRWQIAHYDRDLMRRIKELAPEIRFLDFELWLGHYLATLPNRPPQRVRHDVKWLRRYYFDHNDDPESLAAIESWLAEQGW
ncbi:MAG: hypothetical protein AAF560_01560 [Acidobacteriota bacterium]